MFKSRFASSPPSLPTQHCPIIRYSPNVSSETRHVDRPLPWVPYPEIIFLNWFSIFDHPCEQNHVFCCTRFISIWQGIDEPRRDRIWIADVSYLSCSTIGITGIGTVDTGSKGSLSNVHHDEMIVTPRLRWERIFVKPLSHTPGDVNDISSPNDFVTTNKYFTNILVSGSAQLSRPRYVIIYQHYNGISFHDLLHCHLFMVPWWLRQPVCIWKDILMHDFCCHQS